MRAYTVMSAGAQPDHSDVDIPDPASGEVRVRVVAASVNGFDLAVSVGYMAPFFEHRYPVVLGREFAGVVDVVGDGVDGLAPGDRVLGVVSKPYLGEGAFAEYTTVTADGGLVRTPDGLTDAAAAALGHTGSTALTILAARGDDLTGRTVLIVGATGGVGTLLTQLAAAGGATVIATGRTQTGRALLSELGAAHTVDYADLAGAVRAIAPEGVDAAVHLAGDPDEVVALVKDGGMLVSPVLYTPDVFPDTERVTPVPVAGFPTADALGKLAQLTGEGSLRVIVDREHAFDEVGAALGAYGHETIGNIVVRIE